MSDPNFPKVSLLLHCEGSNGSTTFTDSSSYGRAVTAIGAAQITTASPITGNASGLLDGSTAYLSVLSSADFDFGSGDFTIQIRYKPTGLTTSTIIGRRLDSTVRGPFYLGMLSTGAVRFLASTDGVNWTTNVSSAAGVLSVGVAAEITVSRVGSNLYVLVGGAVVISTTISGALTSSSSNLFIGGDSDALRSDGRFDEARIIKGLGRYSAAYTVTAGPFSDFAIDGAIPDSAPALAVAGEPTFTAIFLVSPESAASMAAAGEPGVRRQPIDAAPESAPGMSAAGDPIAGAYYIIAPESAPSMAVAGEPSALTTADTALVITISNGAADADTPLRIRLGHASTQDAPIVITLIDEAAVGGLDGAGGWPAAPDGRWKGVLWLGGIDRSAELANPLEVTRRENAAALAKFSLRPSVTLAPMDLIGKPVRLAFSQRGAAEAVINAQMIYVGVVERADVDLLTGLITCLCTDQFQEILANTPREWIDAKIGGRFSAEVSGERVDGYDYAMARLKSVPKSMALDVMGNPVVWSWRTVAGKVRVTEADIMDGGPTLRLPSRTDLLTRVEITGEYRFQVALNRGVASTWKKPLRWFINGPSGNDGPLVFLTTDMVEEALSSAEGWDLVSLDIEHPAPGDYPVGIGVDAGVYTIKPETAPDLALGWNARLASRWQQTRTEVYRLTVVATNLEAAVGRAISEEVGVSVAAPDLPEAWSADASVTPRFASGDDPIDVDVIVAARIGDTRHAHEPEIDGQTAWDTFTAAALTLVDQAVVRLWESSRSGRVSLGLPCRPDIPLGQRVEVDTPDLHAEGDLVEIIHRLDPEAGTATTEWTLAVGLPGNADSPVPALALPARPALSAAPGSSGGSIGGVATRQKYWVGGLPTSLEFDEALMVGFVTNSEKNKLAPDAEKAALNWYPLQLTVAAPKIPEEDRDPMEIPVSQTYAWDVPTDLLEIAP